MIFSLLFAFATIPASLHAQSGLTLKDAIGRALAVNPTVEAAAGRIGSSEGLRTQAGLSPNPRLFLQSENTRLWGTPGLRYGNDTDNFAYLSQVFEMGRKRERRVDLAGAAVRLAEAEQRLTMRQIATRVGAAYWAAAGASRVKDLLAGNVANFELIVQFHRDRVREGAMAEADLIRILLEYERQKVSAETAEQDAARAALALFREMGTVEFTPVPLTEPLEVLPPAPQPDFAKAIESRPEVQAARQLVEQARANLKLQEANARPDPEVLFGYKRTAGFNTLIGGFQINLPVRNRNEGAIAAADAGIRVARSTLAATEAAVRVELISAWSDYEGRRKTVTGSLAAMRGHAGETSRIAQAAYREGGADLLRLLDAERARIDSELLYFRTLADYRQSATALDIATGLLP